MTRRRFFAITGAGVGATAIAGCGVASVMRAPSLPADPFAPISLMLGPVRLTAIRTGAVAVKSAHREFGGPALLRMPALIVDPRWTPWLPITCWLVEHPEGAIVVDTGETARVAEPHYFGCNAGVAFVYEHLLRFYVPAAQQVGAQLEAMGHPPAAVRTVALTHLHSDHAGGLGDFPNATFLLSKREVTQPPGGALPCRWPDHFAPVGVDYADGPFGAFATSHALTADGMVRLVPTPGHTMGHQSVVIGDGERFAVLAGDASFSRDQVERRAVAGICEDVPTARRTLSVLAEQLEQFSTVYLASHDPSFATGWDA